MISKQNEVKVSELKNIIRILNNGNEIASTSIYLSGPPGIGKTALYEQMAEELDAVYMVFLTATMDPTDVCGIPNAEKGEYTRFLPPERLLQLTEYHSEKRLTIAAFEDLPACPEQVFAALFRLFHEREVGGYKIRDNVLMCATGNRSSDRAGAQELPTALANRFVHYELGVDSEEWTQWAMLHNIDPLVIAFIARPEGKGFLHKFDPDSGETCFPSPRSVAKASTLYRLLQNHDSLLLASLTGCCGENWANQFINFAKIRERLISVEEIFKNPTKARLPAEEDIDLAFAVSSALASALMSLELKAENFAAALEYAQRLPARDLGMRLCNNTMVIIKEREFFEWFKSDPGKLAFASAQKTFGKYLSVD